MTTERRAMTLIEVMAVIVMLGLMAATLGGGLTGLVARGRRDLAWAGVHQVASRVEMYYLATGRWPRAGAGLSDLIDAPHNTPYFLAYTQSLDPWGNAYGLVVPAPDGGPFVVVSYGRDGLPGGEHEDADILSNARARGAQ